MSKKWLANTLPLQKTPGENPGAHARSTRGETLTETLVGLLIAGLSILMLSMAIASASRLVIKTREMARTYENSTKTLAPLTGTQNGTVKITREAENGVTFTGIDVKVTYTTGSLPGSITGVTYSQKPTSSS